MEQQVEQIKSVSNDITSLEQLKAFIENPDNQAKAHVLATSIFSIMKRTTNWFTAHDLKKRAKITYQEANQKLEMLCTFKMAARKIKDNNVKLRYYKLTNVSQIQKQHIQLEIDILQGQILILQQRLQLIDGDDLINDTQPEK